MTTPNMNLDLPVVSTTPGPEWASDLNDALELVDEHDHTSGKGVAVPSAGLNINDDLSFQSNNLLDLNSLVLDDLASDPASAATVYVKNGELFYTDDSSNHVQITSGGSVAGATGTIGGMGGTDATATYSDLNKDFTFNYDSAKPARLNIGDIRLYPFDGSSVFSDFITIASPDALAAQYTMTLPLAVPSKTSPLVWSGAGVVDDIELNNGQILIGSTAGAVAAGTLTATANQTTITNGANSITIGTVQDINTTSSPTFATPTVSGLLVGDGSVGTPGLRFSGDTNTGLYRVGADEIGVATNGVSRLRVGTANMISTVLLRGPAGSEANPAISFSGDDDTGIYNLSANTLNFTTGGTQRLQISSAGLNIESGGAFKVTIVTGTLTTASTAVYTGQPVYGAFGYYNTGGTGAGSWEPIWQQDSSVGTGVRFINATSGDAIVRINRDDATDYEYRVVVFHS